jgi:manganese/iron transport system substrate-binding protein
MEQSPLHPILVATSFAVTVGLFSGCSLSHSTGHRNSSLPVNSAESISPISAAGRTEPKIVATHSVLCDLVKQIAADTVDLSCLIEPGVDPHVYAPAPEARRDIEDAKLILYGGYNFEPSLIKLIHSTSNPAPKIAVAEVAVLHPLMTEEHHHQGEADGHEPNEAEKSGEEKPETDPHVWHNARNGIEMVKVIESNLAKIVPSQAALYAQKSQALKNELTRIDTWIKSQIATIPATSRKLVTTHDALGYYSTAYAIPMEAALQGISTEEKPTASRIKELVKSIEGDKVPTIFVELTSNPKLIEAVAKEAKVKVSDRELFADGLGKVGSDGDTYQKMLIANTQTIVEGLGGQFTPFPTQ